MSDLVSIVVPAYNAELYLAETLESLLAQTYQNLEIIVVNDGSKDSTATLARRFGDRIRYVEQANQGQAAALNHGWTLSRGQWIGYLSADDVMYPSAITDLMSELSAPSAPDVIYPDYDLIDANSKHIRAQAAPDFDLREMVLRSVCQPGPGALFRRSLFERTGGWDASFRQMPDFDFWLQCATTAKFRRFPKVVAGFRVHEESQTHMAPSASKSEEPVRVIEKYFSKSSSAFSERDRASALAYGHVLSARLHARASRFKDLGRHLAAALKLKPGLVIQPRLWRLLAGGLLGRLRYRQRA